MTEAELKRMVAAAQARYDALTPDQKAAHDKAQRDSFVRAMQPLPSRYSRGQRVIRDGQVLEFIEAELEGEKWRVIGPA